jgi:hypothetical protein
MKSARIYACATCLIVFAGAAIAATATEETNNPAELSLRPNYYPWTFGFEGGSQGLFGGFGSWRFSDHVGLRLGADYTQDSKSAVGIKGTDYDVQLRLLAEPLTLDVYPWRKHSWHISFGWLFNQNELTGSATPHPTIIIDDKPFPIDRVGSLDLRIKQQPVNPYLSIGGNFFYFDHAHRWAFGGELGVAYTGDPKVDLTRNGQPSPIIDAAVAAAAQRTRDWAKQYQWWPVLKLNVSFSF